jgi:hypothetical protein
MSDLKKVKEQLFENGFQDSYPFNDHTMVRYTATNGNSFHIYLDENKPNRVDALRGMKPNVVSAFGLIGEFVGGGGRKGRRFSFKSPKDLKEKLDNLIF